MLRPVAILVLFAAGPASAADEWVALFNGKDMSGWETFLGTQHGAKEPIGPDRDPKNVFSVVKVDGKSALRISGDGLGGIATLNEYGNYHLELEFKWGEKRFHPRLNEPRDSGHGRIFDVDLSEASTGRRVGSWASFMRGLRPPLRAQEPFGSVESNRDGADARHTA